MAQAKGKLFLGVALAAMAAAVSPTAARAQGADRTIALTIPAQPLSAALRQLAEASGLQLIYDTKITDSKTAPALSGQMTGRAALAQLLAGSGLSFQFSGDRTVIIAAAANDGIRSVGVVNVEGVSGHMPFGEAVSPINGINGSRDVEATEGTGSYTTGAASIVTKVPTSIRETPQSVSVITSQRIIDQNLVTIKDVLQQMPGVATAPGSTDDEFNIYSRGFLVTAYSFDGGAAVSYANGNRPVLDLSEFDSVQLIRGADGLFGGYGDPGGVVNLVRKKPLDHNQFTYQQDIGSFSNFREEADITGPITSNHKLRGRAVFAEQDRKFFYDIANSHKTSMYGVLEYDLTPTTLVNVGASYTRENNITNEGGLPRYIDGGVIDWPIATCFCVPYAYDRARKTEIFGTVSQKITDSISTKLNITYAYQSVDQLYYHVQSTIIRGVSSAGVLTGYESPNPQREFTLDYTINGAFRFLKRHHIFTIGGNYRTINSDGAATYTYPSQIVPDVFHFNPDSYPDPGRPAVANNTSTISREMQYGIYGNLKLEIFKALHASIGVRYSGYTLDNTSVSLIAPTPRTQPTLKDHSHSSPNIGVTYDLFHHFTLYGSYESIYQPQTLARAGAAFFEPPPVTGFNEEVGLKWQSRNRRLNASLAAYNIKKDGILTYSALTNMDIPRISDTRSRGVDFELSGQIARDLQLSASYTYNFNSLTTQAGLTGVAVAPAVSYAPRNLLKTWATFRGRQGEPFGRFIIGGGMTYHSSAYNAGSVCGAVLTSATQSCPRVPGFIPYQYFTKGYATVDLKLGYRLNDHAELSLNATNVTNEKAFAPLQYQNVSGYNYYIDPVTFLGSVHLKW